MVASFRVASGPRGTLGLGATPVNFFNVIQQVVGELERQGIRYALIGGLAMGLRGAQRATTDLDFILMLEDLPRAAAILEGAGYRCVFRSENVSHYEAADEAWGRIDLLHAFRGPSLGMLARAELMEVGAGLLIRVVHLEDLVGLKVQAMVNDPSRTIQDWDDIRLMLQAAGRQGRALDWELMEDYLRRFGWHDKLPLLKEIHGQAE